MVFFQCHKVIISACSPVLKAMMLSDMVEATRNQVTLDNIPPAVMELLLKYMYKGEVHISNEYLLAAIEACDYLELLELKARCVNQAPCAINQNNVISWHELADSLNIGELKTVCSEILADSMADISKSEEFLEMNFNEVSRCISDAQESYAESDDLLEATTNWVACKSHARQNYILGMLEEIDLTRCSIECIDTELDKHKELFDTQPAALGKLTKIKSGALHNMRKTRSKLLVAISGHEKNGIAHRDCWRLKVAKFMEYKTMKLPFSHPWHSVCGIPGGIVVSGGIGNAKCSMFLLSSKSWQELEPLPEPRDCHGSISTRGKLYLFGGWVSESESSSVVSLELTEGKWNQEPDIPGGMVVRLPELACVDCGIFLLDVRNDGRLLHLDLNLHTWNSKTNPPQEIDIGTRMTSVKGQLFVTGGICRNVAWYNPTTDTWTTGNNPSTLQHHLGAPGSSESEGLLDRWREGRPC